MLLWFHMLWFHINKTKCKFAHHKAVLIGSPWRHSGHLCQVRNSSPSQQHRQAHNKINRYTWPQTKLTEGKFVHHFVFSFFFLFFLFLTGHWSPQGLGVMLSHVLDRGWHFPEQAILTVKIFGGGGGGCEEGTSMCILLKTSRLPLTT